MSKTERTTVEVEVNLTAEELGKVGYEAYCQHTGGKSVITHQSLPDWENLSVAIREAWMAAGKAVGAYVSDKRSKPLSRLTAAMEGEAGEGKAEEHGSQS